MKILYIAEDDFLNSLDNPHKGITDRLLSLNKEYLVIKDTPKSFVEKKIKFLYIYTLLDLAYFEKTELPDPPSEIIELIKKDFCKLVFIYPQEGNLFRKSHLEVLTHFINKHKLSAKNTYIFNSNFELKSQFKKFEFSDNLITVSELNYFEYCPWFLSNFNRSDKDNLLKNKEYYLNLFKLNKNKTKQFFFTSLNRLSRSHRVFLFTLMHENLKVKNKSMMSLGPLSIWENANVTPEHFNHLFYTPDLFSKYQSFLSKRQQEWIETGIQIDGNLVTNQASNFNLDFYKNSFISIITETEVEKGILFFSEKIFKPIVAGHPFILFGGTNSLKKLKELGYKTFDKWWDESYDSIDNWQERALSIYRLISSLTDLSDRSLSLMVEDMTETLEHNIRIFFDNNREDLFYSSLLKIQNYQEEKKLI